MIGRQEIIDISTGSELTPHVIEKDYVLGWLLWGIYKNESVTEKWVFKGGTCLKKCFFETYRFSEDLDFTLRDEEQINEEFLRQVLSDVCDSIYDKTGIEFPTELRRVDVYKNPRGVTSCAVKIAYRGPVSPIGKNAPRIKLDLTADEVIVLPPAKPTIYHPYTDVPNDGIEVVSYSYEEVFAEKVRALGERTRPRDLYDVINLYRNDEARPEHSIVLATLGKKCDFKGIPVPSMPDLEPHLDNLTGSWGHMLAHQLPTLPPLHSFWDALPEFFAWLTGEQEPTPLHSFSGDPSEEVIRTRTAYIYGLGSAESAIDTIRFAASNRLCVQLDYQGTTRLIEPYSLRRTSKGNVMLHAHSIEVNEHRSYRVDRIEGARATEQTFNPRHQIELTATGPVRIPENIVSARPTPPSSYRTSSRSATRRKRSAGLSGPTYIYECGYCGKTFRRKAQTTSLNPHKGKSGLPCPGRMAIYKDLRY